MGMLGKGSMSVPDVTAAGPISHDSAIPFQPSQIASPSSCTAGKKVMSSQYPVIIAFARHPVLARSSWLDGGMEMDVYVVDCIYRRPREKRSF